jgi:hypothetical protein
MSTRSAGWYADPVTVGAARYWDGRAWTDLVAWGGATRHDPTPLREVERVERRSDATIVSDYLADAARRGVVSRGVADALRLDVEQRLDGVVVAERTPTAAAAAAVRESLPAPEPVATPPISTPVTLPPPASPTTTVSPAQARPVPVAALPRERGRVAHWWSDAHDAVRGDLALHGLAYFGVLLLFAGVSGLIAFSFGEVAPWVRSLAEVLVPTALFLSAWYLSRRGASVVATSLTVLGGAVTPIVVAASLTDGAPLPPDLSGRTLPIVQGIAVLAVAVVMVAVVRRAPSSPLRFIAGPALWLAAGLAAGAARDPVPAGYDAARPDSLQLAVIMAALTLTVLSCSWRRMPSALAGATRTIALPAAGIVYVVELIVAGNEGWPLASTLVVGGAVLFLLEFLADRFSAYITSSLQFVVVAVGAARLAATTEPAWVAVGAALALLALAEYAGWRRPAPPVETAGLVLAGTASLLTLTESAAAAVAFGVLTLWGTWRHARPAAWFPVDDEFGVVAAVAAAVTTAALWDLGETEPALVLTAAAVLLIAVAGRVWRPIAADPLWRWFTPAAALAVAALSAGFPWGDAPVEVASAGAMVTIAMALTNLPIAVRAWSASGLLLWSLANLGEALDLARSTQAVALASIGLALLLGALVVARPVCVHLATIGHVAGLAALAVPSWPGWSATFVVAAMTAGFWATTVVDERGQAVHLAALRAALSEASRPSDAEPSDSVTRIGDGEVMPLMSLAGLWVTAMLAVDAAGWIAYDDPWTAAVAAGVGVLGALIVRVVPWRQARRGVLEWSAFLLAASAAVMVAFGVGVDRDHWAPIVGIALALAVVFVTAPPRPLAFVWSGWAGVGALSVFLADRFGLGRDWTDTTLAAWGAAALLGGLAVHRTRHGPIPLGSFVRDRLLLPPVVLGAGAFVAGGISGLVDGSSDVVGWTAAGMSLVVLATAVLLPLGALVAAAEVLATAAYVLLAPWDPLERTWTFAPWALLLLGAALATRRSGEWSAARWDLPSFFVAHGVGAFALVAAFDSRELAVTYTLFSGLSVAVAAVLRRWPWAAAGAVLALVGGIDAGSGWFALVLLVEGVALTVVGLLHSRGARWVLLGLGATALVGAWFDLAEWQRWSAETVYYTTMPVAAVVALVAAASVRGVGRVRVPRELAGVWALTGAFVVVGTGVVGVDEVGRRAGGLLFAGSLVVLAVAAGVTALVVGGWMRWTAAGLAAAAWAPAAWAVEVSETAATLIGTTIGLAGLAVALATHGFRPGSVWIRPGAFYATATQLGAAGASISALPDTELLIVALLAAGIGLLALGLLIDRPELYVLSPAPALGAWLLYARDALSADANWFTVPIGFTVLVMVGIVRWIRRGRGGDPVGYDVVAVEFVGMSFLVGSALARTLGGHLWNGVLAIGIGVLVAAWGAVTQVRRRAVFGAVIVVLATVLLIGVPLSGAVTWRGPILWLTLSVIGITAIVVASALERGHHHVRRVARHIDEMTAGWELIRFRPRADGDVGAPEAAVAGEGEEQHERPVHTGVR